MLKMEWIILKKVCKAAWTRNQTKTTQKKDNNRKPNSSELNILSGHEYLFFSYFFFLLFLRKFVSFRTSYSLASTISLPSLRSVHILFCFFICWQLIDVSANQNGIFRTFYFCFEIQQSDPKIVSHCLRKIFDMSLLIQIHFVWRTTMVYLYVFFNDFFLLYIKCWHWGLNFSYEKVTSFDGWHIISCIDKTAEWSETRLSECW